LIIASEKRALEGLAEKIKLSLTMTTRLAFYLLNDVLGEGVKP